MKKRAVIYGLGDFFIKNKENLKSNYKLCACIDRDDNKSVLCEGKYFSSIEDLDIDYDIIIIMSESPKNIFQMMYNLKSVGITAIKVRLGISYFGCFSKYFRFNIFDNYRIIVSDEYKTSIIDNLDSFIPYLKLRMEKIAFKKGVELKNSLHELYEDKLNIMWIDGNCWHADHDIDYYYRFEKTGAFHYGNTAVFTTMAIKQFQNPYVLDLGCGDLWYYKRFYKYIEGIKYLGCDFDSTVIMQDVEYIEETMDKKVDAKIANILDSIPCPKEKKYFDVIIWSGSYSVFNDEQQNYIIKETNKRTGEQGILVVCDYFSNNNKPSWMYSINSAKDENELKSKFKKYFNNIFLYIDYTAESFILLASNGKLPIYN